MVDPAAPVKPKSKSPDVSNVPLARGDPGAARPKTDSFLASFTTPQQLATRLQCRQTGSAQEHGKARLNHRNYRDLTVGGADDPGRAAERSPGAVPFGQIGARVEVVAGQRDEDREKPPEGHTGRWGLFCGSMVAAPSGVSSQALCSTTEGSAGD